MNNEEKLNEILSNENFLKSIIEANDAKTLQKKFREESFNLSDDDAKEIVEKIEQLKAGKTIPE